MFTSTISSISFIDHAVSVFGADEAHDATVENHSWGDVITVHRGANAGTYDIHSDGNTVKFIAA